MGYVLEHDDEAGSEASLSNRVTEPTITYSPCEQGKLSCVLTRGESLERESRAVGLD